MPPEPQGPFVVGEETPIQVRVEWPAGGTPTGFGPPAKDAEVSGTDQSVLDETIRKLLTDPDLTIATAYEDTVQIMVEADKLQRSTQNMVTGFDRLFARAGSEDERELIMNVATSLAAELQRIIQENSTGGG